MPVKPALILQRMKRTISVITLALTVLCSMAKVQVESKVDSIQILIGEQAHLTLGVTMKRGDKLITPEFKPYEHITPGIEVLEISDADTAGLDDGSVRVTRTYTITSFDENLYYLPPMKVSVNGKEYQSGSLALKVLTVPVDTLHPEQFFPPKDVQDNPFSWKEWRQPFLLSLLFIALLCVVVYLSVRLRDNKPIVKIPHIVKCLLPHQKAMKEIEKIKAERMTSSGNQKEYYTRLTETLRIYIEERFGFNAMDMTSSEIIARLQDAKDSTMTDELRELFMTADLVKFAKHSTLINENDANLVHAIEFINNTKQESAPDTGKAKPTVSVAERRGRRERAILRAVIAVCAVACVALMAFVAYRIYMLL